MARLVLVTRPEPDNVRTAEALRAKGFEALLAPLTRFERGEANLAGDWRAIVATSANALRALENHSALASLRDLPLYVVGEATAEAAKRVGFTAITSAQGDASALIALISATEKPQGAPLLYLSGEAISRDLASELEAQGIPIAAHVIYRMAPLAWAANVIAAIADGKVNAALHYSRKNAEHFMAAIDAAGLGVKAQSMSHACLSQQVADVLRAGGFEDVTVAAMPTERAIIAAL